MSAETVMYFWAPLCVVLIGLLLAAYEASRRANNKADAISTELLQLREKLRKEEDDFKHIAHQLAANYDERVEGEKKKIEKIELSHESLKLVARICIEGLERMHPGWLEKRINGEPEYEIVMLPPVPKRPAPPPRANQKKADTAPTSPPISPPSQKPPD